MHDAVRDALLQQQWPFVPSRFRIRQLQNKVITEEGEAIPG